MFPKSADNDVRLNKSNSHFEEVAKTFGLRLSSCQKLSARSVSPQRAVGGEQRVGGVVLQVSCIIGAPTLRGILRIGSGASGATFMSVEVPRLAKAPIPSKFSMVT